MQLGADPHFKLDMAPKKDSFDLIPLAPQEKQEELRNIINTELRNRQEFYDQTKATLDDTPCGNLLPAELRDLLAQFVPAWDVE